MVELSSLTGDDSSLMGDDSSLTGEDSLAGEDSCFLAAAALPLGFPFALVLALMGVVGYSAASSSESLCLVE